MRVVYCSRWLNVERNCQVNAGLGWCLWPGDVRFGVSM